MAILLFCFSVPLLIRPYPWMYFFWIATESRLLYHCEQEIHRYGLFLCQCNLISAHVLISHIKAQFRPLKKLLTRTKLKKYSFFHENCHLKLSNFLVEHLKLSNLLIRMNKELISPILLVFLFTNIPINIFVVRQLLFKRNTLFEYFATGLTCLIQMSSSFCIIIPLCASTKYLHAPSKCIPALQFAMPSSLLWHKMKYDSLFGRLNWGPKIAATIGPIREVTYSITLEVTL